MLVETIITKATSQLNAGFLLEAEVGLRGAIVVADRLGEPMAALRARNNLAGLIWPVSLEAALALCRELYDVATRFGQRTWINQAIGSGLGAALEIGRWDDWLDEMREAEPDASEFYAGWFRSEMARKDAYRGRSQEALAIVEEARNSEVVKNSGQASAGLEQLTGEIVYLEGRWDDAYEIGRRGWAINEVKDLSLDLSLLAAAAAADLGRTEAVNDAISTNLVNEFPSTIALRQMGATFKALLEGRWDDARQLFVATSRTYDGMQRYRAKALFGLTVGHLAGDRFPEAAEGLREAEAFFEDRGAGAVVATYRAKAVIPSTAAAHRLGEVGRRIGRHLRPTEVAS